MSSDALIEGDELTAKAAVHGYIILGICFGMPAILAAPVMLVRPELRHEWLPVFCVGLVGVALIFAWLSAFHLQVKDGELLYRTLFAGENRLLLKDVLVARRMLEFSPWKNWGKPRHRLEIFTSPASDVPRLDINLKVFRKRDVELLLRILEPRSLRR